MKKKGNRHKTQRAHRRALKRAAIITMAGAAVIIGAYSLKVYDFRIKYTQTADYMKGNEENVTKGVVTYEEATNSNQTTAAVRSSYKRLDVECVLQNPELPTGCEITSLTEVLNYLGYGIDKETLARNYLDMRDTVTQGCEITALTTVLNYLGYNVDKLTMADYYLDKGKMGEVSPYKAFVGNPRDEDSCGAFAPVLVNSATKYLKSQRSYMNVYNITGAEYNELLDYVDDGHPVLVWETMYMKEPYESCTWNIDGVNIMWLSREHAMVLIGYTQSTYIMADPLRGICEYDKELVETRYKSMGKQAIVIY